MGSQRDVVPVCAMCCERIGSYGPPTTLPCGHNGCLQCMASVQKRKPECPLCRAPFPANVPLKVNGELRDLITLAATLHTVEDPDGWQTLAAVKARGSAKGEGGMDADACPSAPNGIALVPPGEATPAVHCDLEAVMGGAGDLLSLEPPTWLPDSHAGDCSSCHQPFRPLARGRHHCRLCGHIFCGACCGRRLLLPPKFRECEPARCCTTCAALLEPLQPFLAGTISQAVQPAVRDVMDASCGHSWLNPPLATGGLAGDIYKAANIAAAFRSIGSLEPERRIPAAVLRGAAGFAILSMAKVGLGWSCSIGSGLVVARREEDDSWSAPSALAAFSAGWGLQAGGELSDMLIVLRTKAAVAAFCGTVAAGVGGAASIAVGPLGRTADAGVKLGRRGAALCYSYSISRGAFAGVSVEGTVITTRENGNLSFYGRPHSARTLLLGDSVGPPAAASALYQALDGLLAWAEALPHNPRHLTAKGIKERDAAAAEVSTPQFQGCPQDGGLLGSGRRSSRRHSRRSRREAAQDASEADWSPHQGTGDGWETGSTLQLPGGCEDAASDGPPTRPFASPPVTGRFFEGHNAPHLQQMLGADGFIAGGRVRSSADDGPPTPTQDDEEEHCGLAGLLAE